MVNIELSAQQADELKNFYVSELEKILKRADIIKELLSKLDIEQAHISLPEAAQVKEQAPKEITTPSETETKISKWSNFIIQTLREKKKPLSTKELLELYEKQYKISKKSNPEMRWALFELRTKTKLIESFKTKGKKEKLYGLTEWADKSLLETKKHKPDTAAIEHTAPSETEPKNPKWSRFIIQALQENQKPLSINELLKLHKKQYKNSKNSKLSLRTALFNMRIKTKQIQSIQSTAKNEKLYGLTEWADKSILETKKSKPDTAIELDKKTTSKSIYNWPQFIRDTLYDKKRVLTVTEFVKHAMKHFEIPADKINSTRNGIAPVISSLGKSKIIKRVFKKGFRGKFYGLAEWFDYNGDLVAFYK